MSKGNFEITASPPEINIMKKHLLKCEGRTSGDSQSMFSLGSKTVSFFHYDF